jgi:uncharacterized SAM-binding protein YcdF (DUF218 family)
MFIFKMVLRAAALALAVVLAYLAVTGVQVWLTGRHRSTASAGAIVVFGSAEYDGVPSLDLTARLDEALYLYRAGRAPIIATTGGKLAGDTHTEAGVSAAYLAARGVPATAIIVGGGSDTYENVASVAPALKARGVSTVLVVTDPFHEDRAMAICSTFGFEPAPDPTTSSPLRGWGTLSYYLKETVAVAAGRIVGYGLLSNASHPGG